MSQSHPRAPPAFKSPPHSDLDEPSVMLLEDPQEEEVK